jgi:hypothetical protein
MTTAPQSLPQSPATWSLDGRRAVLVDGGDGIGGGHGRIDLDRPATGVVVEPSDAEPSSSNSNGIESPAGDRLLGVDLGSSRGATDHWLRGRDVAAVYEPDDHRRLRATAMWRLHDSLTGAGPSGDRSASDRAIACELILSAQTSILESDSGLAVVTEFAGGRIMYGRPTKTGHEIAWHEPDAGGSSAADSAMAPADVTAVLVQRGPPQGPGSIGLVAVHPADVREIGIEHRDGRLRITCWLFTGSLEQTLEKGVLLRGRVFAATAPVPAGGVATALERAAAAIGRFNASPPPLTT